MQNNFYIVIMAGGSGTRLWPISRCEKPKQFHNLCNQEKSLIQETYERFKDLVPKENIYVALVKDILKMTQEQLREVPKSNFIIEPEIKNTAPAIALVAAKIFKINPEAIIATVPSDHTINKVKRFQKTLSLAKKILKKYPEFLLTIGIKPDMPNTGYGYIKIGRKFPGEEAYQVAKFVEKPDLKTAKKYLQSGNFLWNAGYFIFYATTLLEMYQKHQKDIYKIILEIIENIGSKEEEEATRKAYAKMPKVQIDTAIAEKVKNIAVIPADLGWSDIGNWASLYDLLATKKNGGVVSRGHHLSLNDKNCLVYAQDKLLATVGLEDIIIIDTRDVTLVCHREKAQDIKHLIEKLRKEGKTRYL